MRLTGRVSTYTGLPLAGATLRYRVVRRSLYGNTGPYETAGTVSTDSAGRYAFPVPLTPDSAATLLRPGSNRFISQAEVSQEGSSLAVRLTLTEDANQYTVSSREYLGPADSGPYLRLSLREPW